MAHRTGFFDLPLELRQLIYDHVYPPGYLHITNPMESDTRGLWEADARIQADILDWRDMHYREVRFETDCWFEPWQPSLESTIPRKLDKLVIYIGHYAYYEDSDDPASVKENAENRGRDDLRIIRANLARFVEELNASYEGLLPVIDVYFDQYTHWPNGVDPFWCTAPGYHRSGGPLRTVDDDDDRGKTIFQYLLEPLLELKNCREFLFRVPPKVYDEFSTLTWPPRIGRYKEYVSSRMLRRNHNHAKTFFETMKLWLEGKVSREEVGFHQRWKRLLVETRVGRPLKDEELAWYGIRKGSSKRA